MLFYKQLIYIFLLIFFNVFVLKNILYASEKVYFTLSNACGEMLKGEETATSINGYFKREVNDIIPFRPLSECFEHNYGKAQPNTLKNHMNRENTKIELEQLNTLTSLFPKISKEPELAKYFEVDEYFGYIHSPTYQSMPCFHSEASAYNHVKVKAKLLRVEELQNLYLEVTELFIGSKILIAYAYLDETPPEQNEFYSKPKPRESHDRKLPVTIAVYLEEYPLTDYKKEEKNIVTEYHFHPENYNLSMKHVNLYAKHIHPDEMLSIDEKFTIDELFTPEKECRRFALNTQELLSYTSLKTLDIEEEILREVILRIQPKLPTSYFENNPAQFHFQRLVQWY